MPTSQVGKEVSGSPCHLATLGALGCRGGARNGEKLEAGESGGGEGGRRGREEEEQSWARNRTGRYVNFSNTESAGHGTYIRW